MLKTRQVKSCYRLNYTYKATYLCIYNHDIDKGREQEAEALPIWT